MRKLKRWWRKLPLWLEFTIVGLVALVFVGFGSILIWAAVVPIPSINDFQNRQVAQSTQIYDRTGNIVLYDVHGTVRRTSVTLDQISPYIQQATIAIEDSSFYTNAGVRPLSLIRAFFADLTSGSLEQGGSTITQQVVKNALLTQDKTIARKIEEIILALRLTKVYTKDQILNTYLNETGYGGTIYGVQEAAQYYFGVDAKDVDLAQAAYLAALPQAPTYFSPYGSNKSELDARKNLVLQQMQAQGYITADEYTQASQEQVQFKPEGESGIKAPHFDFYIINYLEQKYGTDAVESGGLKVITTLDYSLQQQAEAAVSKWAPQMETNFNASNEGMVAIDPKTGEILAMVGSKDYFDNSIDGQVNVALANRQPGSSFKPFVYATAFQEGYTPDTVVFDLPTQFSTACPPDDVNTSAPPCYSPGNFDGTFHGPINLRDAIAISDNVASVKVLYLAGIQNSITTAQNLGITTLGDANQYGLTLVLGGGEVNLLQMTGGYSVFANDGVKNPPTGILEVQDSSGNVLEQYQPQPQQVLDPQVARQINDVLSDNVARTPEFGSDSPLEFSGYDVADKTGTTNDFRDVWVLGYTPSIAVGAWAGNNDNTPMAKKIAAFIIAPMWHDFMAEALQKYSSTSDVFTAPAPDPNESSLPPVLTGNWNSNPAQGVHDILYWINKNDPRGPPPVNPYDDPQTARWDYPVQQWVAQNPTLVQGASPQGIPGAAGSTTPTLTGGADFAITSPAQGTFVPAGMPITITGSATNPSSISSVTYSVNGTSVGTTGVPPYSITFSPTGHGPQSLQAQVQKTDGTGETETITFTVQ